MPSFSWAKLNSNLDWLKLTKVRLLIQMLFILAIPNTSPVKPVKLLAKYILIIYTLRLAHEKYGIWIKAVPKVLWRQNSLSSKAERMSELFQTEIAISNWFRCQSFHVLNSRNWVWLMKILASEPGLRAFSDNFGLSLIYQFMAR